MVANVPYGCGYWGRVPQARHDTVAAAVSACTSCEELPRAAQRKGPPEGPSVPPAQLGSAPMYKGLQSLGMGRSHQVRGP